MSAFRIAIIGRPNVGKSSLTNMLAARKVSIVDPTPGVTRDRVSASFSLDHSEPNRASLDIELTDTGGYGVYTVEGRKIDDAGFDLSALTKDIERQIAQAVANADMVLFVIDSQTGVTAQDKEVARLLREGGLVALGDEKVRRGKAKPGQHAPQVVIIANKVDGPKWEMHALEASVLGFGEPLLVSARNNFRRRECTDAIYDAAVKLMTSRAAAARAAGEKPQQADRPPRTEMRLSIVGKRNAGKSTLVNTLAGQERVIVSEIPGTTRDAVDVRFEMEGRAFVAIDTAGLRRKKSFQDRIEWFALDRMERAVDRSDVALLLIDATVPISHIDHQVGMMLAASYKPVVIVINKWDVVKDRYLQKGRKARRGEAVTVEAYESYIRRNLKGLDYAPIAFISGKEGFNVKETIDLAFDLMKQSQNRCSTGKLNRLVREMVTRQGPANKLGTFAKVLFAAQVEIAPPTIVCIVTKVQMFNRSYERFLINRFREELPFPEVPIRLILRGRRPMEKVEDTVTDVGMEAMAKQLAAGDRTERKEQVKRLAAGDSAGFASSFFDEPIAFVDEPSNPNANRSKPVSSKQYKEELAKLPEDLRPEDELAEDDILDSDLLEVGEDDGGPAADTYDADDDSEGGESEGNDQGDDIGDDAQSDVAQRKAGDSAKPASRPAKRTDPKPAAKAAKPTRKVKAAATGKATAKPAVKKATPAKASSKTAAKSAPKTAAKSATKVQAKPAAKPVVKTPASKPKAGAKATIKPKAAAPKAKPLAKAKATFKGKTA